MKFKIEQVAIYPEDPDEAIVLLQDMGATEWIQDIVEANGHVFGIASKNMAMLNFNYDLIDGKEFEILHYDAGNNWIRCSKRLNSVSHFGMHCTNTELIKWKQFFADRGIDIAQEVFTTSHTNPVIAGKRKYHYCIFDTKHILGVDLKFIVRIDI